MVRNSKLEVLCHSFCCSLLDSGSLRKLRTIPTEKKPWLFIPQTACLIVGQAQESNRRGPINSIFRRGELTDTPRPTLGNKKAIPLITVRASPSHKRRSS